MYMYMKQYAANGLYGILDSIMHVCVCVQMTVDVWWG